MPTLFFGSKSYQLDKPELSLTLLLLVYYVGDRLWLSYSWSFLKQLG